MLATLGSALRTRAELALENLDLRQQPGTLRRSTPRPRLRPIDRVFWLLLSRIWPRWTRALVVVQPYTVVRRHRAGFRLWWRRKSRSRTSRRPEGHPRDR